MRHKDLHYPWEWPNIEPLLRQVVPGMKVILFNMPTYTMYIHVHEKYCFYGTSEYTLNSPDTKKMHLEMPPAEVARLQMPTHGWANSQC